MRNRPRISSPICALGLAGWAAQSVVSRGFYALESTWVPTLVGTVVAALMIPLYVVLRQHWGATGLAIASAVAVLAYVLSLGWVQRRFMQKSLSSAAN